MLASRPRRRSRTARLAGLVVAAMVGCLLLAVPASAADTGSIAGVVTGPGGVPLEGVEADVYLQPGNVIQAGWGAITDAAGAYEVPSLPPGDYKVLFGFANVNSPYAQEWYDDAFDEASADAVSVADGAAVTGIDAELAVGARVAGRLTTPAGVGVDNGGVCAHRLALDGLHPPYFGSAQTDADGFFVVQGLPPGTYRLEFYDATRDVGEFWNDKASLDAADDIVLTVGQSRIRHRRGPRYVAAPTSGPVVNLQLPIVAGGRTPQVGYPLTATRGYWTPAARG